MSSDPLYKDYFKYMEDTKMKVKLFKDKSRIVDEIVSLLSNNTLDNVTASRIAWRLNKSNALELARAITKYHKEEGS